MKKMSRENVDFMALYRAQTWEERAEVLYRRAEIFRAVGNLDNCCEELILSRRRKKLGAALLKAVIKDYLLILEQSENELQKAWGLEPDPNGTLIGFIQSIVLVPNWITQNSWDMEGSSMRIVLCTGSISAGD